MRVSFTKLVSLAAALSLAACEPKEAEAPVEEVEAASLPPETVSVASNRNPFPDLHLGPPKRGAQAIAALAGRLHEVAAAHAMTSEELRALFERDHTLHVDDGGRLFYAEPVPPAGPIPEESTFADGTFPNNPTPDDIPEAETFRLHSNIGTNAKIFLNFTGATIQGSSWNISGPIVAQPYTFDADPAFSSAEMREIRAIWLQVAEDFSALDVDVTTERPATPDTSQYLHLLITPTWEWYGRAGGVCFVGNFNWREAIADNQVCWVFSSLLNNNTKNISEAASHESGHSVGLRHWALFDAAGTQLSGYYWGHGNWAPIMGAGYNRAVSTWSRGEYAGAGTYSLGTLQDDLAVIARYIARRPDDIGSTASLSSLIRGTVSNGVVTANHRASLTSSDDVDLIRLEALTGDLSLSVSPSLVWPNADFRVRVIDSAGNTLLEADPDSVGAAAISMPMLAGGTYYLEIQPVGYLDPALTGYSTYGSLGAYHVGGTFAGAVAADPLLPPPPPPPPPLDRTPPSMQITSPAHGSTVRTRTQLRITAHAHDDRALRSVTINANGSRVCSVQVVADADVTCTYNVKARQGTTLNISGSATDAAGNVGWASNVSVSVIR